MAVFWHVVPLSFIDSDRRMRDAYCLSQQAINLINFYQTVLCNIPEDSRLHTRRRENLKSHMFIQSLTKTWQLLTFLVESVDGETRS
jgi:hypothetical protein